jgi:hypothetical protein
MSTCHACGKEWTENYCPECGRTIDRPLKPVLNRPSPEPSTTAQDQSKGQSRPEPHFTQQAPPSVKLGDLTPRKCTCGGILKPTGAQFKVVSGTFGRRTGDVILAFECNRCPNEIRLPEFKMVFAAVFLFPLLLAVNFYFWGWILLPEAQLLQSIVWAHAIVALVMVAGCVWLGSILYQGVVNRIRFRRISGQVDTKPAAAKSYSTSELIEIRKQNRLQANRWRMRLFGSALAVMAVCCAGYQTTKNEEQKLLRETGRQTQGMLENITISKRFPLLWWADYSFDVSYVDDTGKSHRQRLEGNSVVYGKNILGDGRFTHHSIEVIYLPNRPDVAVFPETLGPGCWGYIFAIISAVCAVVIWKSKS